jgi:hypothetical protein
MTESNATDTTATPTSGSAAPLSGARQVALTIVRYGSMLFGTLVLVQVYLAGSGIFAAKGPVKNASSLDPHRTLGNILAVLALLLLIAALVARPSRRVVITVVVLFVLTGVEGVIAGAGTSAPYFGALHPVIALVIMGLSAVIPLWTRKASA